MYIKMGSELQNTIDLLKEFLTEKNLYYFVRDPERAMGLCGVLPNYHIVHILKTQYLKHFDDTGVHYFCLEDENGSINTFSGGARVLLKEQSVLDYLGKYKKETNFAQTFKVSSAFVKNIQSQKLNTINNDVSTSRLFEEKLTQYQEFAQYVPFPHSLISRFDQVTFLQVVQKLGEKFVVQFARGHTGSGTHIIETEEEFDKLQVENSQKTVKFASFVEGKIYTINACATKAGIFVGGLSLQLTGDKGLGATKGATIGNDWSIRANISSYENILKKIEIIGNLMYKKGFKGMFGVDFIVRENGDCVIIEINARQTASVPMYTKIQLLKGEIPLSALHLLEFFNLDIYHKPAEYNNRNIEPDNYSQVFIRAENDIVINHQVNMGVYRLQGDNAAINRYTDEVESTTIFLDEDRDKSLLFQKYAVSIDFMDKQGILVLTPIAGRIVKKGEEITRIQLNQSAIDNSGEISPWIIEALNAIKYHQL